ncbi:ketopantoate reductase family protein [Halalkalibacter urbisdiaboli]|uniref:ketopantoate reductase family protein n=1 Tax=Halalkalibacter urbisdiaboli TaxID=1960589 RepID=UPI000B441D05|nr:2-dehydropantoate 2-reductase N-terminal domain-containing protein [Halalkalibacter urbisdiaboli]
MKVLIFGSGVIGTIYGYVLEKAGNEVTHYVRPSKVESLANGIKLDLIDGRDKSAKINSTYNLQVIDSFPNLDQYDLVIVSVRHYQLESVLPLLAENMGKADILFFNHTWDEIENIDKYIPRQNYLLGFPGAGGGFVKNDDIVLNGALMDKVYLGEVDGSHSQRLEKVVNMFNQAKIKTDIQKNILHWLWVHFAINAGLGSAILKSGNALGFMSSISKIREGVLCAQDAFEVCKSRGVDVKSLSNAKPFSLPSWLVAFTFWILLKVDKPQRRIFEYYDGTEEMKKIYNDLTKTAEKNKIHMPYFSKMKKSIAQA